MKAVIRVGASYIEWAHGPAAEDEHPPAVRLVKMARMKMVVTVPLDDDELRDELHQVADLWNDPATKEHNPEARRAAGRIMKILGPWKERTK